MRKLLFILCLGIGSHASIAASIAPHRAVYDLSLVQARKGANLSSANGRLAFEIDGSSCEGWSVSFRMMNQFKPNEGDPKLVDSQSTSFESGDGLTLRYNQKEFVNSALQSDTRISVARDATSKEGQGELGDAGKAPFTVPANASFPMQHQLHLMTVAESGETRDSSLIYDGSDNEKTFRAITFIGQRKPPGNNSRDMADADAAGLKGLASWPITVSYFRDQDAQRDTPDYQVSFDLYENGVATGLVLDYEEFVLGGDLAKLEFLDSAPCD